MITAVVLAGGSGKRFGGDIPKQYRDLSGKPVIAWSLLAFEKSCVDAVVLVCSEKDRDFCRKEIIEKYNITKCVSIAVGGANRYDSVYCGLKAVSDNENFRKVNGLLAADEGRFSMIHDGARPCIDVETINAAAEYVSATGSCVVGVPVTDTIQIVNAEGDICMTPDRAKTWAAQTPQCFETANVLSSYGLAVENNDVSITDDASAVRKYGEGSIHMLPGKKENLKITTEEDLKTAAEILGKRSR